MRKGGSKQKGSSYERAICKRLSLFLSKGKRDDLFWRSAMSGGRATVQAKKGKVTQAQAGDITSIAAAGNRLTEAFMVECKHYRDLSLVSFFLGQRKGTLWKFWEELFKKAQTQHLIPMLIAKQNGLPDLVLVPHYARASSSLAKISPKAQPVALVGNVAVYLLNSAFPLPKPTLTKGKPCQ